MALFDSGNLLANVALTDTFDQWRERTNQILTLAAGLSSNNQFTGLNSFDTAIAVNSGGTGANTLDLNSVILGNGTSPVNFVAPGANGNLLTSDGTSWVSITPAPAGIGTSRITYTSSSSQNTFSIIYDVGFVDVFLNGVKQQNNVDFIANNGIEVIFTSNLPAGDIVDMVSHSTISVANTYTQAQVNILVDNKLSLSGGTMTGDIVFSNTQTFNVSSIDGEITTTGGQLFLWSSCV